MLWTRMIVASMAAVGGFCVVDVVRLSERAPESADGLAVAIGLFAMWHLAAALPLAAAFTVGVTAWRWLTTLGSRPWRARLLAAALFGGASAPAMMALSDSVLAGEQISQHPHIGLLRVAVPVALVVGSALALLVMDRWMMMARGKGAARALLAVVGIAVFGGIAAATEWWDATQYRGQYAGVHAAAAVVGTIAAIACAGWAVTRFGWVGRRAGIVATVIAVIAGAVTWSRTPDEFERSVLRRLTVRGERLLMTRAALVGDGVEQRDVEADLSFREARSERAALAQRARRELDRRLPDRSGWNLLWITVDTLRADHLGCYGYDDPTSPNLDALAARSARFENAWCQNPITHYSFQSMFYGRYPEATPMFRSRLGVPDPADGCATIARVLRDRGYVTASVPAIPPTAVDHPTYQVLSRDFEFVNPGREGRKVDAASQTPLARKFLAQRGAESWFLWLHYMDPHAPYVDHSRWGFGKSESSRYDSEVRTVDEGIGEVLKVLDARGLADRTIIVVNGDHGESLGDHGTDFHGSTLYEEQVRVPLIVHVPGLPPQQVRLPVENVDLKTTLLDLLQLPPDETLQGDSLVGLALDGDATEDAPPPVTFSVIPRDRKSSLSPSATDKVAVRVGRWKLIRHRGIGENELYDLDADPMEANDIAYRDPAQVERLRGILEVIEGETRALAETESAIDRLRRRLAEAESDLAKIGLLESAMRREVKGVDALLSELLGSSGTSKTVKMELLLHLGRRPVVGIVPLLREALEDRDQWGTVASALAALRDSIGTEWFSPRASELQGSLAKILSAPNRLARSAAEVLAFLDDDRGRALLEAAASGPDAVVAYRALCGLTRLGDDKAAGRLCTDLPLLWRDSTLMPLALAALGHIKDKAGLAAVVDVTRSPFLNHRIARACVEYLAALEDDEAITPLVFLLQRWDPQISNAARRALVARVGQPRVDELTRVGRMIGEALARIAQGRGAGDTDMLLEAADALDPSGAGLIRLYAARASGSARAAQIARDVLADDQAARWHDAARGLVRPADGRHRVEILGLRVMRQLPVIEGAGLAVLAKIRNAGDSYLPGGGWDGGLRLRAVWKSPKGERLTAITPLRVLGENGLAPGAEQWVAAWTEAPRVPATIQHVSLRISCPRVPVKVTGAKEFLPLFQWSLVEHSLPPGELVFKGQHLVHGWGASPALSHGEVESDGTVTFVAMRRDPYVIGPGLADLKRALEITLVYEAVVPGDRDHVILETYFVCEPGVPFSANSWVRRKVPTNVVERLSAVLPPDGDKGLRRLRFDFGQKADLFRVHEIRIRAK